MLQQRVTDAQPLKQGEAMTIEPFKVQGMTFHLDSWEEASHEHFELHVRGENHRCSHRIVSATIKVPIQADTETEAREILQGHI